MIFKVKFISVIYMTETKITTSKPKLCLNMIVKDEAHVIEQTLECISKYIDYYVISDTGSTDGTPEVISNFFKSKNIPGEIYHDKWVNFGHNRTQALKECVGKSQYIWIIDADDIIIGNLVLPNMTKDAYSLIYGKDFTYHRVQIFRNSAELGWHYVGVVHEYPTSKKDNYSKETIPGDYFVDSRRLGNRSKDPKKYLRDANLLEEGLLAEPKNERYMFYLGQSYFDYGDTAKGIESYRKRIKMGGWYEEVFYSYYRVAKGLEILNYPWTEVEKAYLDAFNYCKFRAEPIYEIAKYYRLKKDFQSAYKWAKIAQSIPFPAQCVLFIYKDIYDYKILDELSMDAYYTDKFVESYQLSKKLIEENKFPEHEKPRITANFKAAKNKLAELDKKSCLLFVGDLVIDSTSRMWDFVDDLAIFYKVCIVGNKINSCGDALCVTTDMMQEYLDKTHFDVVVMYDNLNLLLLKYMQNLKHKVVLLLLEPIFKLVTPYNIIIKLTNDTVLNKLFKNVSQIVCMDETVCQKLKSKEAFTITPDNCIRVFDNTDASSLSRQTPNEQEREIVITVACASTDLTVNGFEYIQPDFFKSTYTDLSSVKKKVEMDILRNIQTFLSERVEPSVYMAKYLLDKTDYDSAQALFEKCANLITKDNNSKTFLNIVNAYRAKCLYFKNQYKESFDMCNNILKTDNQLSGLARWLVEDIRDTNIEHIKNSYLKYPEEKISKIVKRLQRKQKVGGGEAKKFLDLDVRESQDSHTANGGSEAKIVFSITTCKRYDLFEKTINSFINCCEDLSLIDCWLCVDDNSSEEDRSLMKEKYPFFQFVFKNESQKGHYVSMNIIHDFIRQRKSGYLLHVEDDWHFVEERNYVMDCIRILKSNETIGQVLFNKNYAEIEPVKLRIAGGINKTLKNTNYILHEYYESSSPEYEDFMKRNKSYPSNAYWPHFSFRPSVIKCSVLLDIGVFYHTPHFEMEYAKEYIERNYKSAFLNTFSCIHTGKKTWEKNDNTANAYNLNKTNQFTLSNSSDSIAVHVLSDNIDNWKEFKERARDKLPYLIKYNTKVDQSKYLSPEQISIFAGNKFNYRRDVLLKLLKHVDIWKSDKSNNNNTLIINDTVCFADDFSPKFNSLIELLQMNEGKYDIVQFDTDELEHGYIVTSSGKKKLTNSANIKTTISDYINSLNVNMYRYSGLLTSATDRANNNSQSELIIIDSKWDFYSQVDSHGYDIEFFANKTVDELKKIAEDNPRCVAFNSLGWMKYQVRSESEFIHLYMSNKLTDGLYVKKSYPAGTPGTPTGPTDP